MIKMRRRTGIITPTTMAVVFGSSGWGATAGDARGGTRTKEII